MSIHSEFYYTERVDAAAKIQPLVTPAKLPANAVHVDTDIRKSLAVARISLEDMVTDKGWWNGPKPGW